MKWDVIVCGCLIAGIAGALEYKWQYPVAGVGYWEDTNNWEKQNEGVGVDLPGPNDWVLFDWIGDVPEDTVVHATTGDAVNQISVRASMRTVTFDFDPNVIIDAGNVNVWGVQNAVPNDTRWNAAVLKSGTIRSYVHVTVGTWERSHASLTVTGPDTMLITEPRILMGENGPYPDGGYDISTEGGGFNSMIISNQAQVISVRGFGVGSNEPGDPGTGSNSWALVTGEGTFVSTATGSLLVGHKGADNLLIVEKGAVIAPVLSESWPRGLHIGRHEGSDRNLVLVRDGGAITNARTPQSLIGNSGSYNRLCITNAGSRVILGQTCIGGERGGTTYTNGTYNTLEVVDGGTLEANNLVIGGAEGSAYNRLLVDGAGSTVTVGYEILLGMRGHTNYIDILNGGKLESLSRYLVIGHDREGGQRFASHGNICTVSGVGSELATTQGYYIGADGCTDNELHISEGAEIGGTGQMTLGSGDGAMNNRVRITSGGKCCTLWSINIGNGLDANENEIYITGEGSTLKTTEYDVTIGVHSHSNRVVVADGGLLHVTRGFYLGGFPSHDSSRTTWPSNNVLRVENGTVETPNYNGWEGTPSFLVRNAGRVEIAGTNSCIVARRLKMEDSSTLRFELGDTAPVQTPLVLNLADNWANWVVIDETVRLEIDAERLMRNGGGKGIKLISSAFEAPALTNLVNNVTFVSGEGSVYLNQEQTALLLNVRSLKNTLLIVK